MRDIDLNKLKVYDFDKKQRYQNDELLWSVLVVSGFISVFALILGLICFSAYYTVTYFVR